MTRGRRSSPGPDRPSSFISRRSLLRAAGFSAASAIAARLSPWGSAAQAADISLAYYPGSTAKIEQIIGDADYAALARGYVVPTVSQTVSRCNVAGTDLGASFEHQGRLYFLCGDTISNDPSMPWSTSSAPYVEYYAGDVFGWTDATDGESGLLLNLFANADGSPLFVRPPGVSMGAFDVPNAGVSLNGRMLLVCNSGSDATQANPHRNDYSVLATFDPASQTFTTGRTISKMPDGHFIITSLHLLPPAPQGLAALPAGIARQDPVVAMFGLGPYRATDVYLALIPAGGFESGAGINYFAGLRGGQPLWSGSEADAAPIVADIVSPPTIGNVSAVYSTDLSLWLMTFDGGRGQNQAFEGIYFTYAPMPWGPWALPQQIFNPARDGAFGDYISNYDPRQPGVLGSPAGPTIGGIDIARTRGGDYAPYLIERFTRVIGNVLTIYYTLSTWNPYTIVRMRSQFQVASS